MKTKFTKGQFALLGGLICSVLLFISCLTYYMEFPHDVAGSFGAFHIVFNIVWYIFSGVACMLYVIQLICNGTGEDGPFTSNILDDDSVSGPSKKFSVKKYFIGLAIIFGLYWIGTIAYNHFEKASVVYNQNVTYSHALNQKVKEKKGFFDKMWKTYSTKEKITNMDKDMFIQVTKIIMENRKDGQNVTWKWMQENQQIPYDQFTRFYVDLSNFIESQREGYFNLEKECQTIAAANNIMLDTFPNNLYNKVMKCPHLVAEYGFTSDHTEQVFKSKKENIINSLK